MFQKNDKVRIKFYGQLLTGYIVNVEEYGSMVCYDVQVINEDGSKGVIISGNLPIHVRPA